MLGDARWGGLYGIHVDFVAEENCKAVLILASDFHVPDLPASPSLLLPPSLPPPFSLPSALPPSTVPLKMSLFSLASPAPSPQLYLFVNTDSYSPCTCLCVQRFLITIRLCVAQEVAASSPSFLMIRTLLSTFRYDPEDDDQGAAANNADDDDESITQVAEERERQVVEERGAV